MADQIDIEPDELRQAASRHREVADELNAAPSSHADVIASLESLGPIFSELLDAGHTLLAQRRACYEQQAAAHNDLADNLILAATTWEQHEAESARDLRGVAE